MGWDVDQRSNKFIEFMTDNEKVHTLLDNGDEEKRELVDFGEFALNLMEHRAGRTDPDWRIAMMTNAVSTAYKLGKEARTARPNLSLVGALEVPLHNKRARYPAEVNDGA
jgi:hypothetical protein